MQQYVKWDKVSGAIVQGPQSGMQGQPDWYPYIQNPKYIAGMPYVDAFDAERGLVGQVITGAVPTPDYRESRSRNYPSIKRRLEMIYADIDSGKLNKRGTFYKAMKAVDVAYPKEANV